MGISQQIGASSMVKWGICTSSTRPASPYHGQHIYETDTNLQFVWNGSAWVNNYASSASPTFTGTVTIPAGASISGFAPLASPALTGTPTAPTATAGTNTTQIATMASRPWNVAWGQVGYVKKTSVTSIVNSPPVTVFSVNFTAVSGRMYKVTTELYLQSASTATYINCAIYNGSTRLQGADYYMSPTINLWHSPTLFTYFSGASGSTTISVQCAMGAGTGQVYADTGGYANALMVEDVGPA